MPQALVDCWKFVLFRGQCLVDRIFRIFTYVQNRAAKLHGEELKKCTINDNSEVFHDYEAALPFVEVPFEQEPFFRFVDRASAEDILRHRVEGSFLARPYKEQSTTIKFIVTVYAKEQFFHLYIRQIDGKYAMGQQKTNEIRFGKPVDIINYFRLNQLLCKNQHISVKVFLVPIA